MAAPPNYWPESFESDDKCQLLATHGSITIEQTAAA